MKYLLDTHVWIWWNMKPDSLSENVKEIISNSTQHDELLLSAISPWEFCKLLEKRRIGISCHPENWLNEALQMPNFRLIPLSPKIAYRSTTLPQPFHNDPGDQIIVASALEENATLLTKDQLILNYKHVRSVW